MNTVFLCKLIIKPNAIYSIIKSYYKQYSVNERNSIEYLLFHLRAEIYTAVSKCTDFMHSKPILSDFQSIYGLNKQIFNCFNLHGSFQDHRRPLYTLNLNIIKFLCKFRML